MTAFLRSPLALTAVVLMGGAAFAGIMMTAYSSGDEAAVPVITAEAGDYKVKPRESGGMDVPFADSTVFDSMQTAQAGEGGVENLLAPSREAPQNAISGMDVSDEIIDITDSFESQVSDTAEDAQYMSSMEPEEELEPAFDAPEKVENLLSRVTPSEAPESISVAEIEVSEAAENTADVAVVEKPAAPVPARKAGAASEPKQIEQPEVVKNIRPAGSSPETLAFVRSVLDQKDGKVLGTAGASADTARSLNGVEPAAGMATMAAGAAGTHFVQLASVTNATAASSEWPKFQAKYSVLSGASHRVQEADLGARGTFYRIQAGPFSESKAKSVCDAIKAQNPGGCLVVKK